jgi:hypothetical protein
MRHFILCARCCTGGHAGYEIAPLVPSLEALLWAAVSAGGSAPGLNTVKHHDMCASRGSAPGRFGTEFG